MDDTSYLKELYKCVRCGSCKAYCPTYDEDKTEGMGARGRMVLLWALSEGLLKPSYTLNDRIYSCIICSACAGTCPSGVDIQEVIYHGRSLLKSTDTRRRYLRLLTKFSLKRPDFCFRVLQMTQHILFPYMVKKGILPFQPQLPESTLKEGDQVHKVSKRKGRVAIFAGCIVNFLFPHLGDALVNVLQRLEYEVILPAGEVCCGIPLRSLGLEEEAKKFATKNLEIFSRLTLDAIVSPCPTCTHAITVGYRKLIGEGLEKALDISSFLIDTLDTSFFNPLFTKATYHDPCHLRYGLGIKKPPREIIKRLGIELIETSGERCCGFGGVFCLSSGDLSKRLLDKCVSDYKGSEADSIITSCPGCMMQLGRGIKNKPVLHLIEAVEAAYASKQ